MPELPPVLQLQGSEVCLSCLLSFSCEDLIVLVAYECLLAGTLVTEVLYGFVDLVLGGTPADCGELVGCTELPYYGILIVTVLTADAETVRQGGGAAEYGDAGALGGIVKSDPA